MTPSGWHAWPRTLLLAAARFVVALAVYAAAQLLSRVLFGDQDRMPLGVVLVASALLATVFYLVDRRLEMLADRLVLGDRAGGYEAVRAGGADGQHTAGRRGGPRAGRDGRSDGAFVPSGGSPAVVGRRRLVAGLAAAGGPGRS